MYRLAIPDELLHIVLLYLFPSPYRLQNYEYCLARGSLLFSSENLVSEFAMGKGELVVRPGSSLMVGIHYPFTVRIKVQETCMFVCAGEE